MSLKILYSGPVSRSATPNQFEISATSAALAGLGRMLCDLDQNTMVKAVTGIVAGSQAPLRGLKLILSEDKSAKLKFREDSQALRLEAGADVFAVVGTSLINSFSEDGVNSYSIILKDTFASSVLEPPVQGSVMFTSEPVKADVKSSKSGWFDQP